MEAKNYIQTQHKKLNNEILNPCHGYNCSQKENYREKWCDKIDDDCCFDRDGICLCGLSTCHNKKCICPKEPKFKMKKEISTNREYARDIFICSIVLFLIGLLFFKIMFHTFYEVDTTEATEYELTDIKTKGDTCQCLKQQ